MVQLSWRQPPLTQEQIDDLFMLTLDDDTEDAPWMIIEWHAPCHSRRWS